MAILSKNNGKFSYKGLVANPVLGIGPSITNIARTIADLFGKNKAESYIVPPEPTPTPIITDDRKFQIDDSSNNGSSSNNSYSSSYSSGSGVNDIVMKGIINMLRSAQAANQDMTDRYLKSADQLNSAGQLAKNRGLDAATGVLTSGREYNPLNLVRMAQDSEAAYDPSVLAADRQLDSLTRMYNAQNQGYDRAVGTAEKVYDKMADAEEKRLEREYKASTSSGSDMTNKELVSTFTNSFKKIKGGDGYVDPYEWMAARELWGTYGGTDSSFVSNFKKYVNPLSYVLTGITKSSEYSPELQGLLDSLK